MNILLPEAIRQVLLWRDGQRTSVELLSPEEEEGLYEKGQKLLNERDWVLDILRLRKRGYLQNPGGIRSAPQKVVSSRGRAIKKVAYQE